MQNYFDSTEAAHFNLAPNFQTAKHSRINQRLRHSFNHQVKQIESVYKGPVATSSHLSQVTVVSKSRQQSISPKHLGTLDQRKSLNSQLQTSNLFYSVDPQSYLKPSPLNRVPSPKQLAPLDTSTTPTSFQLPTKVLRKSCLLCGPKLQSLALQLEDTESLVSQLLTQLNQIKKEFSQAYHDQLNTRISLEQANEVQAFKIRLLQSTLHTRNQAVEACEKSNTQMLRVLEKYDQKLNSLQEQFACSGQSQLSAENDLQSSLVNIASNLPEEINTFRREFDKRRLTLGQEDLRKISIFDSQNKIDSSCQFLKQSQLPSFYSGDTSQLRGLQGQMTIGTQKSDMTSEPLLENVKFQANLNQEFL